MSELMPCPFCGSRGELKHHDDWGVGYGCYACQFEIEAKTDAEAIAAWNRRTPSTVYSAEEVRGAQKQGFVAGAGLAAHAGQVQLPEGSLEILAAMPLPRAAASEEEEHHWEKVKDHSREVAAGLFRQLNGPDFINPEPVPQKVVGKGAECHYCGDSGEFECFENAWGEHGSACPYCNSAKLKITTSTKLTRLEAVANALSEMLRVYPETRGGTGQVDARDAALKALAALDAEGGK